LPASEAPLLERLAASRPFGFGASSLGNLYAAMSDIEADAVVDAAWELGLRYFDTAPFYGFGLSERRLGDALRGREGFLLSTKAGRLLAPSSDTGERHGFRSPMPFTPVYDYSYDGVMRSHEASLQRLGLSRIDILYLHDLGEATHGAEHPRWFEQAIGGGFRALSELRAQGAVSAIGLGVNEVAICEASMAHADFDLFLVAGRYTLLDQSARPFFQRCRASGIGVVAAGVFSSGILATGSHAATAYHDYAPAPDSVRQRVAAIERICGLHGVPLPAVALQFAAGHSGVTLPLVGFRSPEQLRQADRWMREPVPPRLWDDLRDQGLIT